MKVDQYDIVVITTYTWGSGDVPKEMKPIYRAFEELDVKHLITGVARTGDRFYANFCGAVDESKDMLFVHTNLAVTLKIELMPQSCDLKRCGQFVERILQQASSYKKCLTSLKESGIFCLFMYT